MKELLIVTPGMIYIKWGFQPQLHGDMFDWDYYRDCMDRLKHKVNRGDTITHIVVRSTNPNYRQHGEE